MRASPIAARSRMSALVLFILCLCAFGAAPAAAQRPQAEYHNPVIAGDYPDPSVIRAGDDYWAVATTGDWEPEFTLLHSRDLVNWERAGAVFEQRPRWAARDFWAPEISQDHGRFFVYYTARKKDGPLCVAVATAAQASGPYTDRGKLVCQKIGSIDAAAATDEEGARYLIWKEDGNSRKRPTPIWARKLSDDGTRLVGPKKELIRNDPKSWEGGVVEGPFILRRGDWFYLFYSGNACCGRKCNYAMGVARSRKLLGPWEKNPANPILAENETWQCPGHGSIVTDPAGRDFLLYHAYRRSETAFYIGREALLDEVEWGADNWPTINKARGPSGHAPAPPGVATNEQQRDAFFDDFTAQTLARDWRWPLNNRPFAQIETERGGRLRLMPQAKYANDLLGAVLTQPTRADSYAVTAALDLSGMKPGAMAGISAYAWSDNALGIVAGDGRITLYLRQKNKQRTLESVPLPPQSASLNIESSGTGQQEARAPLLYLRMSATRGSQFRFGFSADGRNWTSIGEEVNGSYLEPVNLALTAGGVEGAAATFEWVRLAPSR